MALMSEAAGDAADVAVAADVVVAGSICPYGSDLCALGGDDVTEAKLEVNEGLSA